MADHWSSLYVLGLPPEVPFRYLQRLFSAYGPVRHLSMNTTNINDQSFRYAYVEFEDEHDAAYALRALNFSGIYGQRVLCFSAEAILRMLLAGQTEASGQSEGPGQIEEERRNELIPVSWGRRLADHMTHFLTDPQNMFVIGAMILGYILIRHGHGATAIEFSNALFKFSVSSNL